jgi:DMSO/TMAO reductase YedYZ molybdopterin-dependent catalytic subunit
MKKTSFSIATAIIIMMLMLVFSGSGLKPAAYAESNDAEWQLSITGLVEHPLNLSLSELAAMPQTTVNAAIICVDFPGYVVEEGNWKGVNLWLLLETAGISPDAVKVAFYASDGYSTDLTIETAKREDIILAYEKDGVALSEKLRLVVPGKWGYKWISQVASIELVDYDFKGFWESRGYSDTADITGGSSGQLPPSNPPITPPINPSVTPSPSGAIPEFPSAIVFAIPLILVVLFALILKKRVKTLQMQ